MPIRIEAQAVQATPAKLRVWTDELMRTPPRHSYFGCIEDSDRKFIARIGTVAPLAGYYYGAFTRLWNFTLQSCVPELLDDLYAVAIDAARSVGRDPEPAHLEHLKLKLTRGLPTTAEFVPGTDPFQAFLGLHDAVMASGVWNVGSVLDEIVERLREMAAEGAQLAKDPYAPPDSSVPTPDDVATTDGASSGYRTNVDKGALDRWPSAPTPGTVEPDQRPTSEASPHYDTQDGDARYWIHWTAVEWPRLVRSESSMLYCFAPVNAPSAFSYGGDRPRLIELPGGPILKYPRHHIDPIRNGHAMRYWLDAHYSPYWVEMPGRADFVRVGVRNHIYTAFIEPDPSDDIDWEALRARIEQALKDKNVEEKIKDKIAREAGKLLEGVSVFGFGLGGLASGAASLATSLIMELIEWLLDEFFGGRTLRPIIVVHKTVYTAPGAPISYVDFKTKDSQGKESEIAPVYLRDPSTGSNGPNDYVALPPGRNGFITWEGECTVPEKGALPNMMVNVRSGAVFWPMSQKNGARLFFSIPTNDGVHHYVVALRTEVRGAAVAFALQ